MAQPHPQQPCFTVYHAVCHPGPVHEGGPEAATLVRLLHTSGFRGRGQQPGSLDQPVHIPLLASIEVSLAVGEAVSQRTPHPGRILRQHQTYPTPTFRSPVCPLISLRPAGPLLSPCLQEQLTWVSPRPESFLSTRLNLGRQ